MMQGGKQLVNAKAIALVLLFFCSIYSLSINKTLEYAEQENNHAQFSDSNSNNHQWNITAGQWYSIEILCETCTADLTLNEAILSEEARQFTGQVNTTGILELTIENHNAQDMEVISLFAPNETFPTIRPSPGEIHPLVEIYDCHQTDSCIDKESSILATYLGTGNLNEEFYLNGLLDSEQSEFLGIDVEVGDNLELSIAYSSSDIDFELYFQDQINESYLGSILATSTTSNFFENPNVVFIPVTNSGRMIVKATSQNVNTLWSLKIINHPPISSMMWNLSEQNEIFGHTSKTVIIDTNDTTALIFHPTNIPTNYSYQCLVGGTWLSAGDGIMQPAKDNWLFPLPNSSAIRVVFTGNAFHLTAQSDIFADGQSGYDAPSLPPMRISTDNSSWPTIDLTKPTIKGEFTTSIGDTSDVYKIEITAWEDSVHFVKFEIEGDIESLEIEMISKDLVDWSDIDSKTKTIVNGKLQVAMEVPRGTHFFRISLINYTTTIDWGNYTTPIDYTILTTYQLVDEGEEPWFPPDENAEKWGSIARWIFGFLFLTPAIYLLISVQKKKLFAERLKSKKQRLEWLKIQLDKGISPKQNRRLLAKSLEAVAILDWEEACETWGQADVVYRTENVAIVAWKLDQRIAKHNDSWPIMIGVYIIKGSWEISALRLDSPKGQAWEIDSVTPRFLFSGDEIFLDSMNAGNKTFVSVELSGTASSVDIELNGRMDGEPAASRVAQTLYRINEEE
jgi:hypothetical protein